MNPKIEEIVEELRSEALMLRGYDGGVCWTAADIIEQLRRELIDERYRHDRYADFCVAQGEELSKLKEQQRWIPVTERLPEKHESVLVYFDSGNMAVGFWYDMDECLSLWEVWTDDGWYSETDCEPVYWQPLPERPKEE